MTEPLQVGQFAIVDHEPVDRGPNAGIFHGKGPADDRAELYLVAEGTTPAGEAFAGHVVSAVGHSWGSYDMSLTGALRQLFQEAARNLRDWNEKSIAQHRVSIGVTCFTRRGNQAIIAQAGPSIAFHQSNGELRMYHADEEHGMPIGIGPIAEPQLTRITFGPGDRLLLISTAALRVIDDEIFAGVMALPPEQILPEVYHRVNDLRDVTVFLITDPEDNADSAARMAAETPEWVIGDEPPVPRAIDSADHDDDHGGFQPSLFINSAAAVEAARQRLLEVSAEARVRVMSPGQQGRGGSGDDDVPIPLRRVAGDSLLGALAADRQARVADARARMQATAGAAPALPFRTGAASTDAVAGDSTRLRRTSPSFSRGLRGGGDVPPIPPTLFGGAAPLAEDMARELRAQFTPISPATELPTMASRGGASLGRVRTAPAGRWKGNGALNRRTINPGGQPPAWLVLVLGVGLLIALVGVLTIPGLVQEKEGQQYLELVAGARQRIATATVQEDPAQRRTALVEAREMLVQAQGLDAGSGEVQGLLDQANTALSTLDAIVAPAAVEPIADFREFGDLPVTITKMAIGTENAYLFDSNAGQVIAVSLATGQKEVVYTGDEATGRQRPVTIALTESQDLGGETVLVASAASKLWAFTPGIGLRELPFARPDGMTVSDMTVFGSALFVLDANSARISRFDASGDGYGRAPSVAAEDPKLAAGRRLYAGEDEFVTSDADGALHWFSEGVAIELGQSGIDRRLAAAESPQAMGSGREYGFADPGANRIVVIQYDGTFVRQYQHRDFDGLMAFAVRDGQPYVFSGGFLRRVTW